MDVIIRQSLEHCALDEGCKHSMKELARDARQVGNVIRSERKRRAMSQKDLALRAGLRQATISDIETGSPNTKLQTLLVVLSSLELEFQKSTRSAGDFNIEANTSGCIVKRGKLKVWTGAVPSTTIEEAVEQSRHYTR